MSRQLLERRGGGASTSAMSAVVTTEESSASSSTDIESNNNDMQEVGCNNNNSPEDDTEDDDAQNKFILMHTYNCTTASLMGLGMPTRQFATWVRYYLSSSIISNRTSPSSAANASATAGEIQDIMNDVSTQQVHWENDWENHVMTLRQYWKDGTLLCEHTNLLNDRGGMSRIKQKRKQEMEQGSKAASNQMNGSDAKEMKDEEEQQLKYEHFRNILGSYADRLVNIVEDELSDSSFIHHDDDDKFTNKTETISKLMSPRWTRLGLRGWIENEYGVENTRALMASGLLVKSEKEQLEVGALLYLQRIVSRHAVIV